jgi:hypothetical protein
MGVSKGTSTLSLFPHYISIKKKNTLSKINKIKKIKRKEKTHNELLSYLYRTTFVTPYLCRISGS